MHKTLYLFIITIFLGCAGSESEKAFSESKLLSVADPLTYGLDAEEINEIEAHLQWAIDSGYISGAVALVAKNDQIIYHEAMGFSDREKSRPMRTDHIFRLASMTKPITSTAVMQLVEQGKIDLQDPVSQYIPAFETMEVIEQWNPEDSSLTTKPADKPITIHHLLTHTSGIAYAAFHPIARIIYPPYGATEAWTMDTVKLAESIPKMAGAPLMHQPGERWTYGTSIDVLGYIVEIVSGQPLDQYFQEQIFDPLGIEDIGFYLPREKADRLVDVWFTAGIDPRMAPNTQYPVSGAQTYFSGGAGMVGTAIDYAKFGTAMLNHGSFGENRILKPETVAMMMQNQIDSLRLEEGVAFGYGGSVLIAPDEAGRNAGYWGWNGFWQTFFRVDPENDMVILLMTNAFTTPKWDEILDGYDRIVIQAIED